jgi:hypothetical protein
VVRSQSNASSFLRAGQRNAFFEPQKNLLTTGTCNALSMDIVYGIMGRRAVWRTEGSPDLLLVR